GQPRESDDLLPRARPGDPLGPLLGSALVQALALARLLGRVQPPRDKPALRARCPRDLVVRPRQGGETRARIARDRAARALSSAQALRVPPAIVGGCAPVEPRPTCVDPDAQRPGDIIGSRRSVGSYTMAGP